MWGYIILFSISIVISIIALVKDRIAKYIFKPNLLLQMVDDMPNYEECYDEEKPPESRNQEETLPYDINQVPYGPKYPVPPVVIEADTTNNTMLTDIHMGNKNQDVNSSKFGFYYKRIRVDNKPICGAIQAVGLYGRILSISKNGKKLDKFNSVLMRWVTNNFFETLSVGEYLMLNLCTAVYKYKDDKVTEYDYYLLPGHTGGLHYGLAAGFDIDQFKGNGKYEYEIGIYGKNYNGSKYTITIIFNDNKGTPEFQITCLPLANTEENDEFCKEPET